MKRIKFHTRYNVAARRVHIRDTHDMVDRVSFVDQAVLIQRFIREGQSLAEFRARALNRGLYNTNDVLSSDDNFPVMPIYEQDLAQLSQLSKDINDLMNMRDSKPDIQSTASVTDVTSNRDSSGTETKSQDSE